MNENIIPSNSSPFRFVFQAKGTDNDDEEQSEDDATKPTLTGIPQIDYVWDPNLPRELNG